MNNTNFILNKSDWKSVKFGDVVIEPKEVCKNIFSEGIDHVVGLEHIDTGDIHLRKFETTKESTTFSKKFRKGDVLFGRRRAYLKKAAQANFDGICSGDITVFRAKQELLSDILPFIVSNDRFFDYSVKHSAGGLSPRVKFKDLSNFEFLLPPKSEQVRLAELLWSLDYVIEKWKVSKSRYEHLSKRFLFDSVSGKLSKSSNNWKEFRFGELGETYGGLIGKTKNDFGFGAPFINYMNIFKNSKVDPEQIDYVEIKKGENQNELKYGDLLITGSSETRQELGMCAVVLDDLKGYYLNSFCFGFRLNDFNILLPEYARFLMRGESVRNFMVKHAQGSTRFNLSKTILKSKLKVFLPSLTEQKDIANKLMILEDNLSLFDVRIQNIKDLQKSILNQIF